MIHEIEPRISSRRSAASEISKKAYLINELRRYGIEVAKQGKNESDRNYLDSIFGQDLVAVSSELNSKLPSSKQ